MRLMFGIVSVPLVHFHIRKTEFVILFLHQHQINLKEFAHISTKLPLRKDNVMKTLANCGFHTEIGEIST